jgi:hypothetical protein
MYPADYLSGTGSRRTTSFPQTTTADSRNPSFIYLFIFLSATMRNPIQTSCSNSPTFTWSSASVQSIYLLCLHRMLPCSLQALPTLYFLYSRLHPIYPDLLFLNYSNQHCVSSRPPQSDVTVDQSYNRSRSACRGLNGSILRPT